MLKLTYDAQIQPKRNIDIHEDICRFDYAIEHSHDYWEFLIVLNGSYRHHLNKKDYTMKDYSACLIRPNDVHSLHCISKDSSHLNIRLRKSVFENSCDSLSPTLLQSFLDSKLLQFNVTIGEVNDIFSYIVDINNITVIESANVFARRLITYIIELAYKNLFMQDKIPSFLKDLIAESSKIENISWGVLDIVEHSRYSHAQLQRLFHKYFGCSIIQYLTNNKIGMAKQLLANTTDSIASIASFLGYDSVSHFNHIFKKHTGNTPSQYRLENS